MKKLIIIVFVICFINILYSNGYSKENVSGYWKTFNIKSKQPEAIVKIYARGGLLYGKIIELSQEKINELKRINEFPPKCRKCKGKFKDQDIIGLNFVYDLKNEGNIWVDGKIIDPETGKIYKAKIWVDSKDSKKLMVRVYLGPFYKTQIWKRVDNKSIEN